MTEPPSETDESGWESWRRCWQIRSGTIYLNHGAFGPPPDVVRLAQRAWKDRLDGQPMDFFLRELPGAWQAARQRLASFVGTSAANLVFTRNATESMNIVAGSCSLRSGDEVLLNEHEYGAVHRIWQRRAAQCNAVCRTIRFPLPFQSVEQVCATISGELRSNTKLLVISAITSPTAVTLPTAAICALAADRGIPVCVDGPHAVAQLDLSLDSLGCAYFAASCHKWLSAPFGAGFLYVAPAYQSLVQPLNLSWGVLPPARPGRWDEEFQWSGTADPTACLAIPAAIEFLESVGLAEFRRRTHELARYARQQLGQLVVDTPLTPDDGPWYGSMAHMPLPRGDAAPLQQQLWRQFGIEVPIVDWNGRRWIRVSCHLYTRRRDIDALIAALRKLL